MAKLRRTSSTASQPSASDAYEVWLAQLKNRVSSARVSAARRVNTELIHLYWDIGQSIVEKQAAEGWGAAVVERLARDLRLAFPLTKGFPMPSEFNPVILFSDDLKQIHAALAKAKHADLVALIEQKTTRSASEQRYLNARQQLDENELDFDDVPIVSEGEDGAYVSCWVWISKERAEELAGAARADARSVEAQAQ
jgi:hypothetical protein